MSNPNAPAAASKWFGWIGLAGLLGYAVFLFHYFVPAASAADASGYLNSARLLAEGKLITQSRVIPELTLTSTFQLVPLGFTCEPTDGSIRLSPTYPVGLPLQFAVAGRLVGWKVGPSLVCIIGALAAVWLCYLIARELGVSPPFALFGAAALATNPVFVFIAIQPLSDVLATTWVLAAVYAALRAPRQSGWGLACGAACAMAVLVRPSNVLLLPVVAVLLGDRPRLLGLTALAGLPGAVGLALYQHHLYGDAFRSGYGSIFEIFRTSNFLPTLQHYATWLPRLLGPAILVLPLAALARWRHDARTLVALAIWGGGVLLFYLFYDVTREGWWCLRFVLPGLPALIIAAMLGADEITRRLGFRRITYAGTALILGLTLWNGMRAKYWIRKLDALGPARSDHVYALASDWTRGHLPPNAVVTSMIASGALFYYTDFPILRWDCVKPEDFQRYATTLERAGRPLYALLFEMESTRAFRDHLVGRWEKVADFEGVAIWRWMSLL